MDFEGKPLPDNPFYDGQNSHSYVYAVGLRNPFGLTVHDGDVYVADNGNGVDRVVILIPGANYLWDGTDFSFASAGGVILTDVGGVAAIASTGALPSVGGMKSDQNGLLLVRTRDPARILLLEYSDATGTLLKSPSTLTEYQGDDSQILAAVAVGEDAIYFTPVLPVSDAGSVVFKLRYQPDFPHSVGLGISTPNRLISAYGCQGCHTLEGKGGDQGPSLDDLSERLVKRLASIEYEDSIRSMNLTGESQGTLDFEQRELVLGETGIIRARLWVEFRLMNPRFDDPAALMPALGLSQAEANAIAEYLLADREEAPSIVDRIFPGRFKSRKWLVLYFGLGSISALFGVTVLVGGYWFMRRRSSRKSNSDN